MANENREPFFGYGQQYGGPNLGTEKYGEEFLYAPLYIANEDPIPGATGVDAEKHVEFDLLQGDLEILLDSIEIYAEGNLAYQGATDSFVAPYDGASSARTPITGPPAGHHFVIDRGIEWTSVGSIAIRAVAQDIGAETTQLTQIWYFQVLNQGPTVTPITPTAGATGAAANSNIVVQLHDADTVVLSTMRVYVKEGSADWELAYEGGGAPDFKPGWDGPASALSGSSTIRTLTIDKTTDLTAGTIIQVWVMAEDPAGEQPILA